MLVKKRKIEFCRRKTLLVKKGKMKFSRKKTLLVKEKVEWQEQAPDSKVKVEGSVNLWSDF